MRDKRIFLCDSSSLPEKQHLIQELCYKGEPHSAIVLRFSGQVSAKRPAKALVFGQLLPGRLHVLTLQSMNIL